jgi:peptide/nickel transport system permease protein
MVEKAQPAKAERPTSHGVSSTLTPRSRSRWRVLHRLLHHPTGMIGAVILLALALLGVLAPYVTPYDPIQANFNAVVLTPSLSHPFGTDNLGRDVLSRLLAGIRISLPAGLVAVLISSVCGTILGVVSGYYRGVVDATLMRLTDLFMAMPGILLSMVFIFTLGPSLTNVMIAVGLSSIPYYLRLVRGSVLSAREHAYVEAARVIGAPNRVIMFRHVLPNVVAPVLVIATLGLGSSILAIAGLSFLGLGAQPPTPEWGAIVNDGRARLATAWWISTFGGVVIMITVLAINLLGDALRDAFDPRLQSR